MENLHIQVSDLVFAYKKGEPILKQLNMAIPKGAIYGFLGKNGAGKTTTIRNMLGLLQPNSGTISLLGKPVSRHSSVLFRKVGNLIENPSLYEHLSGIDNLRLACKYYLITERNIPIVLDKVGLSKAGKGKVRKYSTGMKQRLGLAMALIHEPELLILDEPIRGLDPKGIQEIRKLILEINDKGTTILLSSHILSEIEKLVSHVGILENGKLQFEGTFDNLLNHINASTKLRIRTSDATRLYNYLSKRMDVNLEAPWVTMSQLSDTGTASLIRELCSEGYEVYEIRKDKNALESIFLGMTNKNTN